MSSKRDLELLIAIKQELPKQANSEIAKYLQKLNKRFNNDW